MDDALQLEGPLGPLPVCWATGGLSYRYAGFNLGLSTLGSTWPFLNRLVSLVSSVRLRPDNNPEVRMTT